MSQASNVLSTQLKNRDASPQILNDPGTMGANSRTLIATLACITADTTASVYRFFTIPSNAVIHSLKLWCDALSASTTLDVGVYQTTINGGLVANTATTFASAIAATSAVVAAEERYNALAITTAGQQLWQLIGGLTVDPAINYDICVSPHVAIVAGGNITLHCSYGL